MEENTVNQPTEEQNEAQEQQQTPAAFNQGDVAVLMSGSPKVTVESYDEEKGVVSVVYFCERDQEFKADRISHGVLGVIRKNTPAYTRHIDDIINGRRD